MQKCYAEVLRSLGHFHFLLEKREPMKYLTKEWYQISQQTWLHGGIRVHKGANVMDEGLYQRLYKRKEKEYISVQREMYDYDPRTQLEEMIPVEVWLYGASPSNHADEIINKMTPEEKERYEHELAVFHARAPFDVEACRQQFRAVTKWNLKHNIDKLPSDIRNQIADMRVFSLGYCSKETMTRLKQHSQTNQKLMQKTYDAYCQAQQAEAIPPHIRNNYNFHDCSVTQLEMENEHLTMSLDTTGGFTLFNRIKFLKPEILLQEPIINHDWLYSELYVTESGYEVHILFDGESMAELILRCHDILIEKEE